MTRTAVVIMAKAPRAGRVKTRLSPPLSPQAAADLYQAFLLDKLAQVRGLRGVDPALAYTPAASRCFFAGLAADFILVAQQGVDLSARLSHCLAWFLAQGHRGVLLIDSDTPTLPTAFLQQAVDLLAAPQVDVVLGPSADGGYYLIGLRQLYPQLFHDMAWSTATVLQETRRRAMAQGLRVACLPAWYDVDTPADLERLQAALRQGEGAAARHTRRFFLERY